MSDTNKDQFGANYPAEYHHKIMAVTVGKTDYLILEYLVNNAFLQGTHSPRVNWREVKVHYGLNSAEINRDLSKLIKKGLIVQLDKRYLPNQSVEYCYHVPMVREEIARGAGK